MLPYSGLKVAVGCQNRTQKTDHSSIDIILLLYSLVKITSNMLSFCVCSLWLPDQTILKYIYLFIWSFSLNIGLMQFIHAQVRFLKSQCGFSHGFPFIGGLLFHMLDFVITSVFKIFMFCYSSFSVI